MECSICGHRFTYDEERVLITCEHNAMLCPCGVYGYACLSHERELPQVRDPWGAVSLTEVVLSDDWRLVILRSGNQLLKATLRQFEQEPAR